MIQWFYRWLGDRINNAQRNEDEPRAINTISRSKVRPAQLVRESDDLNTEPIQFKMFKACGGWAIEFRQYDNRNDRVDTSLYVVNDEQELGKHISQIITMEALKR